MISDAERRIQRKNTEAFIRADSERIVLEREDRVADGAGGWKMSPKRKIRSQMMKFQVGTVGTTSPLTVTDEGRVNRSAFTLVALWDADLLPDDTFEVRGASYRVQAVTMTEFQKKAVVVRGG